MFMLKVDSITISDIVIANANLQWFEGEQKKMVQGIMFVGGGKIVFFIVLFFFARFCSCLVWCYCHSL